MIIVDKQLNDLLIFWSGSPVIDPNNIYEVETVGGLYPKSHSCLMQLRLPTGHTDYESFIKFMQGGISCPGFGVI